MKHIPLEKQSKRRQKAHYASRRGSWDGIVPVTRIIPDKKKYDRKRAKEMDRGER